MMKMSYFFLAQIGDLVLPRANCRLLPIPTRISRGQRKANVGRQMPALRDLRAAQLLLSLIQHHAGYSARFVLNKRDARVHVLEKEGRG